MTRVVDLTDRLAQLRGEPVEVTFAGRTWSVPGRSPRALAFYYDALVSPRDDGWSHRVSHALSLAVDAIFGAAAEDFYRLGGATAEIMATLDVFTEDVYGTAASSGNSGGSSEPSEQGSTPSAQTSTATTGSTSRKSSGKTRKKSTG